MWLKIYTSNYLNLWCNILDRTVSRFYGTRSCNAVFTKSHTWTLLWIGLVLFILLNLTSLMTDLILLSHIGLFHLSFASFLAGLSLRNTGFDRRSVHVRFVVDEVLPRLFFFSCGYFGFPLSVSFHQWSALIYMMLSTEWQMGEAWKPAEK